MKRKKQVTAIHKVNSFKLTDGLFLECCRKISKEFPEVVYDEQLVDSAAALFVRCPERFDVVVATNFYGDILSDLATELSGSIGLAGSMMANDDYCCAQAQHGSAPDIAGKNLANPSSMILSVSLMLQWMAEKKKDPKLDKAYQLIDQAVDDCIADPKTRTKDLGGTLGCKEFGAAVSARILAQK